VRGGIAPVQKKDTASWEKEKIKGKEASLDLRLGGVLGLENAEKGRKLLKEGR